MPKGSKVLMADDDAMLLDMYKERLGLAGYIVEAKPNGEELLAKVKEFQPDIILLDIMMPKLDGYGTLVSLKSDPSTKDIPVVMLTALMRDFNKEKAMDGGADDYLIKSEAMPSDVITKVEQVLVKYGKGGATPQSPPDFSPAPPAATTDQKSEKFADHIETQPISPPPTEAKLVEDVPVVEKVGPSEPITEKKGESNLGVWIWLGVFIITAVALVLIYFFFIK